MSQDTFKVLCDSLLPGAAMRCLEKQKASEEPCSIYWSDIIDELDPILQEQGFERLDFAEAEYYGWAIGSVANKLLGENVVKAVQQFNKRREDEFHAEIERHRFTS